MFNFILWKINKATTLKSDVTSFRNCEGEFFRPERQGDRTPRWPIYNKFQIENMFAILTQRWPFQPSPAHRHTHHSHTIYFILYRIIIVWKCFRPFSADRAATMVAASNLFRFFIYIIHIFLYIIYITYNVDVFRLWRHAGIYNLISPFDVFYFPFGRRGSFPTVHIRKIIDIDIVLLTRNVIFSH